MKTLPSGTQADELGLLVNGIFVEEREGVNFDSDPGDDFEERANPYHDAKGRFAHGKGAVTVELSDMSDEELLQRIMFPEALLELVSQETESRVNPYHDKLGKFASKGHGGGSLVKGKDQSSWAEEVSRDMENDPLQYGPDPFSSPVPRPLVAIAKQQGFNGLPQKGSVDEAIAAGGLEIHRGIIPHEKSGTSAEEIEHRMLDGNYEPGKGNYGNGFYFSTSEGIGKMYADAPIADKGYTAKPIQGGRLVRAALHKDAKVVDYEELQRQHKEWAAERHKRVHWNGFETDFKVPKGKVSPELLAEVNDPGHFAALMGYDAIRVPLKNRATDRRNKARIKKKIGSDDLGDEIVVLNRTALVVDWRGTPGV